MPTLGLGMANLGGSSSSSAAERAANRQDLREMGQHLLDHPSPHSSRGSPEPFLPHAARPSAGPRAAFLANEDPSMRNDIDDTVRMRSGHTEFAPVQLSMNHNYSTASFRDPQASTANLLSPTDGFSSSPMSRNSSRGSSSTSALQKERPKTRYEDFEAGQKKLVTQSHSHAYDIMPDIDLLNHVEPEKDDALHDPGRKAPRFGADRRIGESPDYNRKGSILSARGMLNGGALLIILLALVSMFGIYPIVDFILEINTPSNFFNSTGQVPVIEGYRGLIDKDTPANVLTRTGFDGEEYTLVFSDEFEQEGRTFWPGDDPYWTAIDSHYYGTNNLEWYDPRAAFTQGGSLYLNFTRQNPRLNHGLNFSSGMLQSWNQFCFTGGYIEAAVNLPGRPDVVGFWPGVWTMGNLGRAGYGSTNEGTWPFSYDSCDVGTYPNQTDPATGGPPAVTWKAYPDDAGLSYQPGQKFSACTCKGEDHPGPWLEDEGRYRGRAAPEIDVLEATVEMRDGQLTGTVSQTVQFAPFDAEHDWNQVSPEGYSVWPDVFDSHINPYQGNTLQQSCSGLPSTDQESYELVNPNQYQLYGFEYQPSQYSNGDGFVTFMQGGQRTWQLNEAGVRPNNLTQIGQRLIPDEPMYAILNFGMSPQFGVPDFENLVIPAIMKIDYVRIYQRSNQINIGCDPPNYPTYDYIQRHIEAYTNPNLTIWSDYTDAGFPKNKNLDQC